MRLATLEALMRRQTTRTNGRGNTIHDAPLGFLGERYEVDFAPDFSSEGWEQYDTDQDAHYFGVWVNRSRMLTLTYAEGDTSMVVCPDWAHFEAEVRNMGKFYGEGFEFVAVDLEAKEATEYRQDRTRFTERPEVTA